MTHHRASPRLVARPGAGAAHARRDSLSVRPRRHIARSMMFIALLFGGLVGGCPVTARTAPVRAESPPPPPPPPPAAVSEPAPAKHPAYLHALTDLRTARAFLARPAN